MRRPPSKQPPKPAPSLGLCYSGKRTLNNYGLPVVACHDEHFPNVAAVINGNEGTAGASLVIICFSVKHVPNPPLNVIERSQPSSPQQLEVSNAALPVLLNQKLNLGRLSVLLHRFRVAVRIVKEANHIGVLL